MVSIIIPAHNESSVLSRTLSALLSDADSGETTEVIVVCNGCTDDTANIARCFGSAVRVIETDIASKTHALNLGDQASRFFPRVYTDADIVITGNGIRALVSRLERGEVSAVAPTPEINLTGCPWLVRKYYSVRSRLPSSREGIGGSGVYALSEGGRKRFVLFPEIIADDAYVRFQFKPAERETLPFVKSIVFAPRKISQLIAIRTRAYTGMLELAERFPELWMNKGETNNQSLIGLLREPRSWVALVIYCYVNIVARCRASIRYRAGALSWQRDNTSRVALSSGSSK